MGDVNKAATAAMKAGAAAAISTKNKIIEPKDKTKKIDSEIFGELFALDNMSKLPQPEKIVRRMGYNSIDELEEYRQKNPELYKAMGGIKYDASAGSILEKREYKTGSLQYKAKERIIERIKNSDINELQKSIDIFNSNEWKDAYTSKKHSKIINTYVDDWIALENMGYFNHLSKADRDCAVSGLKELKDIVNSKKEWFSKYNNINDFNKDVWSNKYGAMTWDELEKEERKIKDSLLQKNVSDNNYSLQEFNYVKSLRSDFDSAESYDRYIEMVNMPFEELTREFLDTHLVLKKYNDIQDSRNATYLEMYNEHYQVLHDAGYITKEDRKLFC